MGLGLLPHTISHTTTKGETLKPHALQVISMTGSSDVILEGLIDTLTYAPTKYANLTTAEFKLVSFRNTAISKDGIMELIVQQNSFLHATMQISVVDGGICDDIFKQVKGYGEKYGSICAWAMNEKTKDDMFLFHSVKPGQKDQSFFLHEKTPSRGRGMDR